MSAAVNIPDEAVAVTRDALVVELRFQLGAVADQVADHLGGSQIALCDARDGVRRIAHLGEVLEQLDPPGWSSSFAGDHRPDAPRPEDESGDDDVSHDDDHEGGPQG